ncbi:MAG: superoxide dismutase [Desulfobacteraceae bacterium]|nr:superoxide dismutase [Desulfobacteraceae bacterium]
MITLPDLPYPTNGLEPHISARTLEFHHGKHHKTYVDTANKLLAGTSLAGKSHEEIIRTTAGDSSKTAIFNNAAQAWNHAFYWQCLKPRGGGRPTGEVARLIDDAFGGFDKFVEGLKNAGTTQFGSGWAWLVASGNRLEILKTPNAESPLHHNKTPLLTVDVWEHAYYLDYQNRRADYLAAVIDKLINWEFVNANLAKAREEEAVFTA